MPSPKNAPLLSLRATVVLFCAVIIGATAGLLTYVASKQLAQAALAGGAAFCAAVAGLHAVVGP
ncbi:hypothetical protein H7J87_12110 [Mycolicibacterium wolinskyi]|nr:MULTISPECIES: hypothetical protein [Mycolicibacterium]MCV7286076.1 hypothetical protein [Mycolicibacterium wolinskyi]MCV7296272.1 hypothetical protein [Mycolicibacterium goodii]